MQREFGRVKFWNDDKGFGFIRCDDGNDLFVHVSSTGFLRLNVGDRVSHQPSLAQRAKAATSDLRGEGGQVGLCAQLNGL
jgi:cold shock protein